MGILTGKAGSGLHMYGVRGGGGSFGFMACINPYSSLVDFSRWRGLMHDAVDTYSVG